MGNTVYINEEEGKKRVMNNVKLYTKLLTKFQADTNMNDLMASTDAQDWEKAQGAAHSIKGLSANLSLTELFNQSLEVESQIKGKSLKQETLENLKACYEETLIQVGKVIAKNA